MAKSLTKALSFWALLTLFITLTTLFFSFLRSNDPNSHFLNLPSDLRRHYFSGKLIKLQSTQIFVIEHNPQDSKFDTETVLFLHGLGLSSYSFRHLMPSLSAAGIYSVAIDFPGSGFSGKIEASANINWFLRIWQQIREKGVFWAFDQLVETGEIQEPQISDGSVSELFGQVVGQVFDEMSLRKPVHLVVHDSAWAAAVSWVLANDGAVRSVTFLDSSPAEIPAFPFRFLEMPVVGDLVVRSRVVFGWLVKVCCLRMENGNDVAEVYRSLMKYNGGKKGIVEVGNGLNYSFDLGEWARSEGMKEVKLQVLWSNMWSDRWIDEGRRIAALVPEARFGWHSGGRWPQEDAAEEIAGKIAQFVLSLPKFIRHMEEEPLPEHIKEMPNEEISNHHHDHRHAAGYFSSYGLGQEWGG